MVKWYKRHPECAILCHFVPLVQDVFSQARLSMPTSLKNGAPPPIPGAGGGSTHPDAADVRSVRLAGCDLPPSAPGMAKWRLEPSKNRHLAPLSSTFLTIFSGFFRKLSHQGAIWRDCGPKKALFLNHAQSPTYGTGRGNENVSIRAARIKSWQASTNRFCETKPGR